MPDGQRLMEIHPLVEVELANLGAAGSDALRAIRKHGSLRRLQGIPDELKARFPTALEIKPEWHVRMQAAFQAHVDAAVSKTVNLPPDSTTADVLDVFGLARSLHLKGITIYRYGSRPGQTLSLIAEETRSDCRECAV